MVLTPVRRNPLRLPEETVRTVMDRPLALDSRHRSDAAAARISVVVVTFNNLLFNRMCLESLAETVDCSADEIVVVDNASSDGTREYLRELSAVRDDIRIIENAENRGFAPAANQGLSAARGDYLVLLNNDTLPTPGWLERLAACMAGPDVGLVGPVTNRTGNEAQIEASYATYAELLDFAEARFAEHGGRTFEIPMLAMFCVGMPRSVLERVGPLDERFEIGFFEDDDYSLRVRSAGLRVLCAEGIFLHHFAQASFGDLAAGGQFGEIFHRNRRLWEQKWNREWTPHKRRVGPDYEALVERIRTLVADTVPEGTTLAVVTKGDSNLLDLPGRKGWHFPQDDSGDYSGHYPLDSAQAMRELDTLRRRGAEFLLIPETSLWWLDHYSAFHEDLRSSFRRIPTPPNTCALFDLRRDGEAGDS